MAISPVSKRKKANISNHNKTLRTLVNERLHYYTNKLEIEKQAALDALRKKKEAKHRKTGGTQFNASLQYISIIWCMILCAL